MPRLRLAPICLFASIVCSGFAIALVDCDDGGAIGAPDDGVSLTGCKVVGATPPTAPNGYYVNGNTICTASGEPHLLHGVDRPSLEWASTGDHLSQADFKSMATWHANVVRVALNQDFWLADSPVHDALYQKRVQDAVQWAHIAGLDVILDLHWSDQGDYTVTAAQQKMADPHSLVFWQEVATIFKGDGRVFFELYNEPHDIPPDMWLNGGSDGFQIVGMQQLHDAIRRVGAENLVIAGGLNYAYDLTVVQSGLIAGHNIMYATHPYSQDDPHGWFQSFGYLTATQPVIATEFGDGKTCTADYTSQLITYADAHSMSWTAWAWYPGGCSFPSLLSNWNYGTSAPGAAVKTALLSYNDPTPPGPDAGGNGGASASHGAGGGGAGGKADTTGSTGGAGIMVTTTAGSGGAAAAGGAAASGGAGPTASSSSSSGAGGANPTGSSSGGAGGTHAAGGAGGTGG